MKDMILSRLKEPSTWAGVAAVFLVVPTPTNVAIASTIKLVGTMVAGALAIWLPEKK